MTDCGARAARIKLIVFDVDGVLTDGKLLIGMEGELCKAFDAQDGFGITLLRLTGMKTAIITGRNSKIVALRAAELKIDQVVQGEKHKLRALCALAEMYRLTLEEIAYVGDDLMDIPAMQKVGLACAVDNAVQEVKQIAHFTAARPGGSGAVRQIAEMILKAQGKWEKIIFSYLHEKPLEDIAQ